MLKQIIEGKESSSYVIIQDSTELNGRGLLKSLICSLTDRVDVLHLVLFETSPERFTRGMPAKSLSRLKIHNGAQDPLGWQPLPQDGSAVAVDTDLWSHLVSSGDVKHKVAAVVVDSLSSLILHRSVAHTCRTMHRLVKCESPELELTQVVGLLHGDLHDETTRALLHHSATSVINVQLPKRPEYHMMCNTLHKKPSGKVFRIREHCQFSSDFQLISADEFKPIETTAENQAGPDPTANLTFNLSLTDTEKQARNEVQLPYMHAPSRKEATLERSVGEGKIFYQPDEADDFDEEDPDDDLDI